MRCYGLNMKELAVNNGIVIDANVIHIWYREWLEQRGDLYKLIFVLSRTIGLAADAKGRILNEWEHQAKLPGIREWIDDELKNGRLSLVNATPIDKHSSQLHIKLGLDRSSTDTVYVWCAYSTTTKHIMSWDVDLFDPKAKSDSKKRAEAMTDRKGKLCRYLEKNLDVCVCEGKHCMNLLASLMSSLDL